MKRDFVRRAAAVRTSKAASKAASNAQAAPDAVAMAATVGVIAAGVALFEVALIPGMVIGAAAVLAPTLVPKLLPEDAGRNLGTGLAGLTDNLTKNLTNNLAKRLAANLPKAVSDLLPGRRQATGRDRHGARPAAAAPPAAAPAGFAIGKFAIGQAVAKTITFRIIVTTLDFSTNYLVIGELTTAAGLSGFSLVVGPLFYLVHESTWNYFGPPIKQDGLLGPAVDLPVPLRPEGSGWRGFTISRALAKTITFRTIATVMDFTTNYVVVGNVATAAVLSASGFVLGPFVYLGHEMAWDHYGRSEPQPPALPAPVRPVAAPG